MTVLPLGMIVTFLGYGLSSYGWILVKGYNITPREWFSPLHPYQGSLSAAGTVPKGHIFPTSSAGASSGTGGTSSPVQQQQRHNLQADPNPHGFVQ